MHRRPFAIAVAAAALLLLGLAGNAFAAILLTTLSADAAPPGAQVTLGIEMTGRQPGTAPGVLLLVPVGTFDEPTPCEEIEGATVLGDTTWQASSVGLGGSTYPGMASETHFVVPQVPDGAYYLAETWADPYTRCFSFASFAVDSSLPDTAVPPPSTMPFLPAVAGALVLVAGVVTRWAQRRS